MRPLAASMGLAIPCSAAAVAAQEADTEEAALEADDGLLSADELRVIGWNGRIESFGSLADPVLRRLHNAQVV